MKLYILEEEFDLDNNIESIEEIFDYIKQALEETDYNFSYMRIDGEDIYDEFEIFLEDNIKSIKKVETIMLTTKEIIINNLLTINEYVEGAVPIINSLANNFYEKPESGDWKQLTQLTEGIGFILHTFENINTMENLNEIIDNYKVWNNYSKQVKLLDETVKKLTFKSPGAKSASFFVKRIAGSCEYVLNAELKASLDICSLAASPSSSRPCPILTFQSEDIPSMNLSPEISSK